MTVIFLTGNVMSTLYQRIGAEQGVAATVDLFYRAVLADPLLAHFFDGVDMERQQRHQGLFLKYALGEGEPPRYRLGEAHRRLVDDMGLNEVHFNAVLGHVEVALLALNVHQSDVETVTARLELLRKEILRL